MASGDDNGVLLRTKKRVEESLGGNEVVEGVRMVMRVDTYVMSICLNVVYNVHGGGTRDREKVKISTKPMSEYCECWSENDGKDWKEWMLLKLISDFANHFTERWI